MIVDGTQRGRLVMDRSPGESVLLTMPDGTQVIVAVHKANNNRLRLVIDAPKDVHICRTEFVREGVK